MWGERVSPGVGSGIRGGAWVSRRDAGAHGEENDLRKVRQSHVMMRSPHSGSRWCGIVRGQALSLLRAFSIFFCLISFLVSLNSTTAISFLLLCYHACHVNADDMQSTFYLS